MRNLGVSLNIIVGVYFLFTLAGCGGGAGSSTKPDKTIPVVEVKQIYKTGKYFHANKFYHDKALTPFSSISSVINDLSGKAAAHGSTAFLVTKSYEKHAKGAFMNGIHAFVEGWGITWKSADKKTLIADIKNLASSKKGMPVVQAQVLTVLLQRKKIKEALPYLRDVMTKVRLHRDAENSIITAYFRLADAKQNNDFVKLSNSANVDVRFSAIVALSRYGTKKHKPIFIKILSEGKKRLGDSSAAEGLLRVGNKKDIRHWKKYLNFHPDEKVKLVAAEALLKYSQRNDVVALAQNTSNSSLKRRLQKLLLK